MLVFWPEVVDLLGQFVNYSLTQKGSQEEVLHRVERGRLVEAALIVVPMAENVLCPAGSGRRQRFGRWCLMDLGGDGDPSLMSAVDGRKHCRTRHL